MEELLEESAEDEMNSNNSSSSAIGGNNGVSHPMSEMSVNKPPLDSCKNEDGKVTTNKLEQLEGSSSSADDNDKRFRCDLCDAKFNWKNGLKTHVQLHTDHHHHQQGNEEGKQSKQGK